jgi:hypothetical protein
LSARSSLIWFTTGGTGRGRSGRLITALSTPEQKYISDAGKKAPNWGRHSQASSTAQ